MPQQVSTELQQQRYEFMNKLVDNGIIEKIEKPGKYAHVWIMPTFYTLKFTDKESFINVVYAYYISENPKSDIVILYDSITGKEVGNYAAVYGGLKMK